MIFSVEKIMMYINENIKLDFYVKQSYSLLNFFTFVFFLRHLVFMNILLLLISRHIGENANQSCTRYILTYRGNYRHNGKRHVGEMAYRLAYLKMRCY